MKIKIEQILIIFLVSLSFFRVDLSVGLFSFLVSPQFFLSTVIILIFFAKLLNKEYIHKSLLVYSSLLILLLSYFLISIFFNYHGSLQFKRYILFFEIILSSIAFLFLFNQFSSLKQKHIIRQWIKYSITTHLIWISIQFALFFNGFHFYADSWSQWKFINPLPHSVGFYFPRLEGGFLDPNVCGYYFSFLFFLARMLKISNKKNNALMILFIALTISRSAIAAFFVTLAIFNFNFAKFSLKKVLVGVAIFVTGCVSFLAALKVLGYWDYFVKALTIRLTSKGSTNIHNSLLELGFQETIKSLHTFFLGSGFSSSPYFAYDLLKVVGNKWKYANFHSEYISIFFETGILGLILYYSILFFPFIHTKKSKVKLFPILLLILLQGVFYQQYNFHYYWVVLAIVLSLNLKNAVKEK